MTLQDLFVICLAAGGLFTVLSLIGSGLDLPHLHLHWHAGHGANAGHGHSGGKTPFFNASSAAAFLMWFGGTGYILTRLSTWGLALVLVTSALGGVVGAALIVLFLTRFLLAREKPLDPSDYDMTGAMGRLSSPIREGGTGEMIFSQQGRRCGVAVRSESGAAMERGTEVVVTRYEGGIAWVRPFHELVSRF